MSSATSSSQKVLFIGRSSSSSLFALSKDNYPALGDPDTLPGQGRRIELEGYHYLDESDNEDIFSRGKHQLGIDGPSPSEQDSNGSRGNAVLRLEDDETVDLGEQVKTPSRSWLVHVFAIYLPLLLVGLTGLWKFLGSTFPVPSSLVFSSPLNRQQPSLLPPFDTKPISLSTILSSPTASSTNNSNDTNGNGNTPSFDSKLKDLPPLPVSVDAEDEEGQLVALEAGMANGKKKRRRGKVRGKKKSGAKGGEDEEGEGEEEDAGKDSVAVVASARENVVLAPEVVAKDGGLVVSEKLLGELESLVVFSRSPDADYASFRRCWIARELELVLLPFPRFLLISFTALPLRREPWYSKVCLTSSTSSSFPPAHELTFFVLTGTFQSRPVAVKRLLSHFTTLASHEVSLLQSTDFHPNIVRYFYEEKKDPWLYIALELCPASLADLIERPTEFPDLTKLFEPQAALKGISQGVRHLHELKVCHRDIKPG